MNSVYKDGLTVVDREIISLLRDGCTSEEIGRLLRKSKQTVKNHLMRIGRRLGIAPGHGLAHRILQRLDGDVLDPEKLGRFTQLQQDIISQAIHGSSHRDIARNLGLRGKDIVRGRLRAIYDVIGASNARELRTLLVIPSCTQEVS